MFSKYLGVNKFTIGFLTLTCMLFICKYMEIVHMYNKLLVFEVEDVIEQYEYSNEEFNNNEVRINRRRICEVKKIIKRHNTKQLVRNRHHEQVLRTSTTIIVVEVRTNIFFLDSLIESLKQVVGITNSLLIFSHETFDEDINEIIKNISFAKYIQIYYPYSVQLHPDLFPGDDSRFCKYDLNCVNNDGQRNATLAQVKHHWWWRTSFVFDRLRVTKDFNGTIAFLDDDQCVTADFIYILKMLEKMRLNSCPYCNILNLGVSNSNTNQYHLVDATMVVSKVGVPTRELMGIAFNRSVWNSLKSLTKHFCDFNDANWTSSLVYATSKSSDKYHVLSIEGPRVFRFAQCPYEDVECGDLDKVEAVQSFMKKIKRGLFPRVISIRMDDGHVNISRGHGGWDDARDREFCKYFIRRARFG